MKNKTKNLESTQNVNSKLTVIEEIRKNTHKIRGNMSKLTKSR